jgi:dihydroorotase
MKILIRSVEIIEPNQKSGNKLNLLLEDGIIQQVTDQDISADRIVGGDNLLVSAGWVDMNACMGDPGLEHKEDIESFVASASSGGYTELLCLPNTKPVIQTKDIVTYIKTRSEKLLAEIHPIAALTLNNKGEELSEMIDLYNAGAIAFSDGINPIWHSDILLKSLQYTQKFDGLVIQRPEDRHLSAFGQMNEGIVSTQLGLKGIPAISEEIVVMRDLKILEYTGGKLHFSLISTSGSLNLIKEAKKKGLKVTCDIAAYMLALDDSALETFDTNYKVNPPLREKKQVEFFRKAVKDGIIDVVVSGHRPHDMESKDLEFDLADFGMIGLQNTFALANTYTDLSDQDLVSRLCYKPREILNLPIPAIREGEKANLTVFDRSSDFVLERKNILSKSKNTPFVGVKMKGRVAAVFNQSKHYIHEE